MGLIRYVFSTLIFSAEVLQAQPLEVPVRHLAMLPEDVRYPEGLAVAPDSGVVNFSTLVPPSPATRLVSNPDGSQDRIAFGASGMPAPNGMVGNLYVSDSFQGAILRIASATDCQPCKTEVLMRDPLLATSGFAGLAADGSPRGLLFPASTAILGERMLVTNLALPLTEASGDEREERVTRWNLVQFGLPTDLSGEDL
jgi:hypothetical protein